MVHLQISAKKKYPGTTILRFVFLQNVLVFFRKSFWEFFSPEICMASVFIATKTICNFFSLEKQEQRQTIEDANFISQVIDRKKSNENMHQYEKKCFNPNIFFSLVKF